LVSGFPKQRAGYLCPWVRISILYDLVT